MSEAKPELTLTRLLRKQEGALRVCRRKALLAHELARDLEGGGDARLLMTEIVTVVDSLFQRGPGRKP